MWKNESDKLAGCSKTESTRESEKNLSKIENEFEEQFEKWEREFENWKSSNAHHPNKEAYKLHLQQFENVRQQLLLKRQQITQNQKSSQSQPGNLMKFDIQYATSEPYQQNNLTQLQPHVSERNTQQSVNKSLPAKMSKQNSQQAISNEFQEDSYDEIQFDSFNDIYGKLSFNNYEYSTSSRVPYISQGRIPGLDMSFSESMRQPLNTNNIDLKVSDDDMELNDDDEDEGDCYVRPNEPPPLPVFKTHSRRQILNINELQDEPGRSQRHERIMILIRGAPGSGKSFLANLILEKEVKMGNNRCIKLSINRYSEKFNSSMADKYQDRLLNDLRNTIRDEIFKFIVVEVEGGKSLYLNKFVHVGITIGNFKCYVVELHQTLEACLRYNSGRRGFSEICEARHDIAKFPAPAQAMLLDPTPLLAPQAFLQTNTQSTSANNVSSIANLLQDKNVMELVLQSQLSSQHYQPQTMPLTSEPMMPIFQPEQSHRLTNEGSRYNTAHPLQQSLFTNQKNDKENFQSNYQPLQVQEFCYDDYPTFQPAKFIDYKHSHKQTFEEQLLQFKVFRITDHKHKTSQKLKDFVIDIDTEKIIEKRRSVLLRKKILEYLKKAERPEDTVSNPKYPKNWEAMAQDRPPTRNKRKKKLTLKIKGILMRKDEKWMEHGYSVEEDMRQMSFEDISSDESIIMIT